MRFVNADDIARALRDAAPPGSVEALDRRASDKTEELRESFLAERLSFCTEIVFSDPQGAKLDFLKRAREAGYAMFLVFIGLSDPMLSVTRVAQRVQTGGDDVPDDKLRDRFPRTLVNLRARSRSLMKRSCSTTARMRRPLR